MVLDLIVLDDDYQPATILDNHKSLIWTERYAPRGEFEFVTGDIENTMRLLTHSDPDLEVAVTIPNSTYVAFAEVFLIEKPKNSGRQLKVTGRMFDCALERRSSASVQPPGTLKTWLIPAVKSSDAAYLLLRYILGDAGRVVNGITLAAQTPLLSTNDAIPELQLIPPIDFGKYKQGSNEPTVAPWVSGQAYPKDAYVTYGTINATTDGAPPVMDGKSKVWRSVEAVTSTTAPPDGAKWIESRFEIKAQDLDSTVAELLAMNYRGLRSVRPVFGSDKVGLEIYNGADLRERMSFDVTFDQVESAQYLLSKQGSTNIAYVYSSVKSEIVQKTTTNKSGLARRIHTVDISSESPAPADLRSRGLIELYKYNATAVFDGQIAESVAEGYNRDYFLGDIVKLVGDYGLERNVRIAEFIRSSEASGDKAYPTLEVIDE